MTTPANSPGVKVEQIWAYIVEHADGDEAIPAIPIGGTLVPMIGADRRRIESIRDIAVEFATAINSPITLARFTTRTDEEVINP